MEQKHEYCQSCGSRLTYELSIDKGTVKILKTIAKAIKAKGINVINIAKEVLGNGLDHNEIGNISRPRYHGLVAKVPGQVSNYALTRKGIDFLNGLPIQKTVIIRKGGILKPTHVIGHSDELVTINQIEKTWGEYWSADGYTIKEGKVINKIEDVHRV